MDLLKYIGRKVKVVINNNYYFIGTVVGADDDSLDMIDVKNKNVSLRKETILTIQETSR